MPKENHKGRLFVAVDIEADGPIPGEYSMVSFGAVAVYGDLSETFYGKVRPISDKWMPEKLAISGHTRAESLSFDRPECVMRRFCDWIEIQQMMRKARTDRAMLISDNPGFDAGFLSYYLHRFAGENPFGWSCIDVRNLYRGMKGDMRSRLGKIRKTKHTHHPVDDALGNAEAFERLIEMGLHVPHKA